jgi:hypothetical protein
MPTPPAHAVTARLEARIPVQVYDQMRRAARLGRMTLSGYLISPSLICSANQGQSKHPISVSTKPAAGHAALNIQGRNKS